MAAVSGDECTQIRDYEFSSRDQGVKNFAALSGEEQVELLERIKSAFQRMEAGDPAAGYQVLFVGSNGGSNPMEVHLYAYGHREAGSPMKMPIKPSCPFCAQADKQMEGFEEPPESAARVIQTLQRNAMVISAKHTPHFMEASIPEQQAMLRTAAKIVATLTNGPYNYELHFHCGTEGHQKIPHSHGHLLVGTNVVFGPIRPQGQEALK